MRSSWGTLDMRHPGQEPSTEEISMYRRTRAAEIFHFPADFPRMFKGRFEKTPTGEENNGSVRLAVTGGLCGLHAEASAGGLWLLHLRSSTCPGSLAHFPQGFVLSMPRHSWMPRSRGLEMFQFSPKWLLDLLSL